MFDVIKIIAIFAVLKPLQIVTHSNFPEIEGFSGSPTSC